MPLETIVSAEQLAELGEKVLILDCRFDLGDTGKGAQAYARGHVPGAIYAHLDRDLSDLSGTRMGLGRHPLPSAPDFSRTLQRWGWQSGTPTIAYDDAGGAIAVRAWWLLRMAGEPAAVLDGGFKAWREAGLPIETESPMRPARAVSIEFDHSRILDSAQAERLRGDEQMLLLDARAAARYRGENEPIDETAGHVPGARNRPWGENLQANGRFKEPDRLRAEFEQLMQSRSAQNVVHMCGSGVTACHNLIAMEYAGLDGSRLYAPSWSGWISDSARPVATGEA